MSLPLRSAGRVALVLAVALAGAWPAAAQTREERRALEAQQQSRKLLLRIVDAAMAGKVAPGAFTIKANAKDDPIPSPADALEVAWRHHTFKAVKGMIYVPFTLAFEPGKTLPNNLDLFVRAVKKGTPLAKSRDREESPYPFEQFFTGDAVAPAAGRRVELTRRIVVPPGEIEVYVAMLPAAGPEPRKGDVMLKGVLAKYDLDLPDLWNGELTTSSLLLIDKMEALTEAPTQESIVFKPYSFTGADMVIALDDEFKRTEELTLYFHVYNPVLENKRPDLTIDYEFLKITENGEEPATTEDGKKLVYNPQKYNAQTLPPHWDPEVGYQVAPGFAIPLNLFPAGSYRINIKITDNKAAKTITREVRFKVVA